MHYRSKISPYALDVLKLRLLGVLKYEKINCFFRVSVTLKETTHIFLVLESLGQSYLLTITNFRTFQEMENNLCYLKIVSMECFFHVNKLHPHLRECHDLQGKLWTVTSAITSREWLLSQLASKISRPKWQLLWWQAWLRSGFCPFFFRDKLTSIDFWPA